MTDSARELLVRRLRDEQARCLKCFHEASQGDHGGWWMAYELNRDAANTIENLLSENADGWISVGYAQELPPNYEGRLLLMATDAPPEEIHDNGRPMYRLYRSTVNCRLPAPPTEKGK